MEGTNLLKYTDGKDSYAVLHHVPDMTVNVFAGTLNLKLLAHITGARLGGPWWFKSRGPNSQTLSEDLS